MSKNTVGHWHGNKHSLSTVSFSLQTYRTASFSALPSVSLTTGKVFFFSYRPPLLFASFVSCASVCVKVPSLVPVLLFKLGKEKNPLKAHAVLNCLPNLGTHKVLSSPPALSLSAAPHYNGVYNVIEITLVFYRHLSKIHKWFGIMIIKCRSVSLFMSLHPHHVLSCFQLCVPMVLQTLHMLASAPRLRAVAMRLMTTLWKKQVYFWVLICNIIVILGV